MTDAASETIFTSSIPTNATVSENTEVTFICSFESNPVATLSLIAISDTEEEIAQMNSSSWTVSVILKKEQNGLIFMCSASGSDPVFSVDSSARYKYNVECKYIHYLPCIHFTFIITSVHCPNLSLTKQTIFNISGVILEFLLYLIV